MALEVVTFCIAHFEAEKCLEDWDMNAMPSYCKKSLNAYGQSTLVKFRPCRFDIYIYIVSNNGFYLYIQRHS